MHEIDEVNLNWEVRKVPAVSSYWYFTLETVEVTLMNSDKGIIRKPSDEFNFAPYWLISPVPDMIPKGAVEIRSAAPPVHHSSS